MNVSASDPLPLKEIKEKESAPPPDTLAPSASSAESSATATSSGVISSLLIVLIALSGWYFFIHLFPRHARAPVTATPPPVAVVKEVTPLFVPLEAHSQPPVIQLPVANTESDAEASPPDTAALSITEENTGTTTVTNPRSITRKQRRLAAQQAAVNVPGINVARVEQTGTAIKSGPAPRAAERAPSVMENTATLGVTKPRLNTGAELRSPGSVSTSEPGTTIINYSGYSPDDPSSIDFASISAVAPTPKPSGIKPPPARPASGLVIIVNKANPKALSKADISNIYRDRITRWPSGERILALNLPLDSGERRRFSAAILDMSPLDAATEDANRAITNRVQNDYRTKNAQVVVSYIEHHENAIGYVEAAAIGENNNVRVVYSIP